MFPQPCPYAACADARADRLRHLQVLSARRRGAGSAQDRRPLPRARPRRAHLRNGVGRPAARRRDHDAAARQRLAQPCPPTPLRRRSRGASARRPAAPARRHEQDAGSQRLFRRRFLLRGQGARTAALGVPPHAPLPPLRRFRGGRLRRRRANAHSGDFAVAGGDIPPHLRHAGASFPRGAAGSRARPSRRQRWLRDGLAPGPWHRRGRLGAALRRFRVRQERAGSGAQGRRGAARRAARASQAARRRRRPPWALRASGAASRHRRAGLFSGRTRRCSGAAAGGGCARSAGLRRKYRHGDPRGHGGRPAGAGDGELRLRALPAAGRRRHRDADAVSPRDVRRRLAAAADLGGASRMVAARASARRDHRSARHGGLRRATAGALRGRGRRAAARPLRLPLRAGGCALSGAAANRQRLPRARHERAHLRAFLARGRTVGHGTGARSSGGGGRGAPPAPLSKLGRRGAATGAAGLRPELRAH